MKKIISFLSVLVFVLVMTVIVQPVNAASNQVDIGEISVFASKETGQGHAFLMFKNTSSDSYMVGNYELQPNKTVTVGTWGNKDDGRGVYYNLEAYFINNYDAYQDRVSIKMTFDSSQLETFTKSINANNKWSLVNNCSKFVEKVWNSVATGNMKINAGFIIKTPSSLQRKIWLYY